MKKHYLAILLLSCMATLQAQTSGRQPPPVMHLVLFQFNESTTPDQIGHLMNSINSLEKQIPGIIEITSGKDFSGRSKGYSYAVTIKFVDAASLNIFYKHSEHEKLVQQEIKPIVKDMIITDYEVTSGISHE